MILQALLLLGGCLSVSSVSSNESFGMELLLPNLFNSGPSCGKQPHKTRMSFSKMAQSISRVVDPMVFGEQDIVVQFGVELNNY